MSKESSNEDPELKREKERTKRVEATGWVAGLSAFFALGTLVTQPLWPVAFGIAAVAAMVTVVCLFMLKR